MAETENTSIINMVESENTSPPSTRTQLINLEGLNAFLEESTKIFEPTLPEGTDGQVLKLSGGKPSWGTDNTPTTFAWTEGTSEGPTGTLSGDGMSGVNFTAIPSASETASGVVTTGAQTFAGAKTFNDTISGSIDGNAATSSRLKTAVSLTTTDGTNTSGAVSFDGSEAISIKLPTTIAATFSGDLTGNVSGNATTATTADKTAHSLSVKDSSLTSAIDSWDGSVDKILTIKGESPVTTTAADGVITIAHSTSGVAAGTYRSLTVDAKGHVTNGTNPNTLDDYGVTDAKIADGTITLGSNTITPLTAESTLAASKVSGTLSADNIPNLDAAKITTGTISIERLPAATQSDSGFMSAADKTKLDGIATGANNYTHPTYTAKSSGFYKVAVDGTGHVSDTTAVTKDDITGLGIPGADTTNVSSTTTGTGNAVTSVTASGSTITVTKGATFLTEHQDISGKLDKLDIEYNKDLSVGQYDYICIGKFPCYDSNITIYIDSSTTTTYHGVLIIATQNINTSGGGTLTAHTYGDVSDTLTSALKLEYNSGSNSVNVYFQPQPWSKNLFHIRCNALAGAPKDIATAVSSIPSTANRAVTNLLKSALDDKAASSHTHTWDEITSKPTIPSKTSQLTNDSGFITGSYLPISGGTCTGNIYAPGFYISSSRKVKENINPTKVSGEDMINSVSVVDFNYIDDESKSPKVGFIAEDTDPLFSTRERKAMDSANCIGILMKAVQELSTKVKNLTSELETLTSKVKGGK